MPAKTKIVRQVAPNISPASPDTSAETSPTAVVAASRAGTNKILLRGFIGWLTISVGVLQNVPGATARDKDR